MGDVYSRLDELSDLGPRDGWKELEKFQKEIFRSDYESHLKTDILAKISHQFEEWKKERKEYKKGKKIKREFWVNSEKKTKDLEGSIKEIERDLLDLESKDEFSFLNHAFKEIEKDYKETNLAKKHHKKLSEKLKQLKNGIKTKKNELIEGERNAFYSSINPNFQIPSLIDYDYQEANTEEDIDISRIGTEYVLETNLDSLLELYSDLFKFKSAGSKKSELRPQQVQYLVTCFEAITNNQDVIIEGPTGLGKTRALIGAVLPYILNPEKKKKILYTTRTITQVDNVAKEIKELREVSPVFSGIKATVFVGRERIREDKKCYEKNPDIDPSDLVDDDGKLFDEDECNKSCKQFFMCKNDHESLDEKLSRGFSIDLDSLDDYPFCPVKIYQKASKKADIIIAPHTYLSDTYWIKKYLLDADTKLEDVVLIVDESHNYVGDCANQPFLTLLKKTNEEIDMIGSRTNNQYCMHDLSWDMEKQFLNRELEGEEPIIYENVSLREFFYELRNIYSIIQENVPRQTDLIKEDQMDEFVNNLPAEFVDELEKSNNYIQSFLNDNQEEIYYETKPGEKTKFLRRITHHMHSYSQLISSFIEIIDNPRDFIIKKEDEKINFYNLTPEKSIERDLKKYSSKIFTSATITPVKDVATVTGLEDAIKVQIDPVFPEENYKPFIITGINSSRKGIGERAEYFSLGEKEILTDLFNEAFSSAKTKNIGVFCNSNNCVEEVYGIIKKITSYDIIIPYIKNYYDEQFMEIMHDYFLKACSEVRMNDLELNDTNVVEVYKQLGKTKFTSILLSVSGGALSEGVDYVGNQMEMVITVGLPYPSSATEREINDVKKNYFHMLTGNESIGEDLAFKQDTFRKLAQTIGRTHRRMDDRAVIICADERLLGVKNDGSESPFGYELLNTYNAMKNLQILQKPVRTFDQNIVIPGSLNEKSSALIKKYISSHMSNANDFISFEQMGEQIRDFYRK